MRPLLCCALVAAAVAAVAAGTAGVADGSAVSGAGQRWSGSGYLMVCTGACDRVHDAPAGATSPGMAMMGGHMYPPDAGPAADAAFEWLTSRSGNGSFVVLKSVDEDDQDSCDLYNEYIFSFGTVRSVTSVCLRNRTGAFQPAVGRVVRAASGFFVSGGDQYTYVQYWTRSLISEGIDYAISHGRPFGGSSAGLAIQGEYVYTAANDTVRSPAALENPFDPRVTVARFLRFPFMGGLVTDSHFFQRQRMGRLVAFMARIWQAGWEPAPLGVGVSEQTAVLVDEFGVGRVIGDGPAYFVRMKEGARVECEPGQPLSISDMSVFKFWSERSNATAHFDFTSWRGSGGTHYRLAALQGKLVSDQQDGSPY